MVYKRNKNFDIIRVLLVVLVCPVHSLRYYQYRHPPPPLSLPRPIRQSNYYLNTQRYVAVPGRIVQHYNAATVPYSTAPVVGNVQLPLISPPLLQSYYELESDPSSSNPDPNPESNEDDTGGGGLEPPPMSEPEQPPPMSEPEQPPPMSEPEQPPPMMTTMPPPDNDDQQDNNNPPPPPHNPHAKIIHKHISIHAAPDELESDDDQTTVIRPKNPGPDKHVNIIFIKAPSMKSSRKKTEVILPSSPEQKTLVYILVKRPDPANDGSIKVRGPAPTMPPKPQVYFIRYKQQKEENNGYRYAEKKRNSYYH